MVPKLTSIVTRLNFHFEGLISDLRWEVEAENELWQQDDVRSVDRSTLSFFKKIVYWTFMALLWGNCFQSTGIVLTME